MGYPDLPSPCAKRLAAMLGKSAESKAPHIGTLVNDFIKEGAQYRVREFSKHEILLLRKYGPRGGRLCVGFPFPVFSERMRTRIGGKDVGELGVSARMHLRGEPLRKAQRAWIREFLRSLDAKAEWSEVDDVGEFRRIVRSVLLERRPMVYVDPYTYIGDGIIGLHFLDRFMAQGGPGKASVASDAHMHMTPFFDAHEKTPEEFSRLCKGRCTAVMPDLIDSHLGRTLSLMASVRGADVRILLVGRNLLIEMREGHVAALHYDAPDPLLRDRNIEDYMEDCLLPFLPSRRGAGEPAATPPRRPKARRGSYLINPFTSTKLKDMDASLAFDIARRLSDDDGSSVHVSTGVRTSKKDVRWARSFQSMVDKDPRAKARVRMVSFENLGDMAKKLGRLRVSAVLTGDTSVSHLANRLGIPNVTVYKPGFWDPESVQSLTSDSPLGFCRYAGFQFPALAGSGESHARLISESLKGVAEGGLQPGRQKGLLREFHKRVDELMGVRLAAGSVVRNHAKLRSGLERLKGEFDGGGLSWAFSIYDPHEMVKGILRLHASKTHHLVRAAWKISPVYKLGALR